MKVVNPKIIIPLSELSKDKLKSIELYGRVCYKSEDKANERSTEEFLESLIRRGHDSVIEHEKVSVKIITDRGVTHEIVRHRIGSYSQESTRYCNYSLDKFENEITVIKPFFYGNDRKPEYDLWYESCLNVEQIYFNLIKQGSTPQEARSVLPNSLKTEIVVTYNLREWRYFLKLRCSKAAHPQMQQIAIPLLLAFSEAFPCLFKDIAYNMDYNESHYATIVVE